MNLETMEDRFTSGGDLYPEEGEGYYFAETELGSSIADAERACRGLRKTFTEFQKDRMEHPGEYRLRVEIFETPPFNMMNLDQDTIFKELRDFPSLKTHNIGLLVLAYLYRQKYPDLLNAEKVHKFHRKFSDFFNKVDLYRYILIYDRYAKSRNEKNESFWKIV